MSATPDRASSDFEFRFEKKKKKKFKKDATLREGTNGWGVFSQAEAALCNCQNNKDLYTYTICQTRS